MVKRAAWTVMSWLRYHAGTITRDQLRAELDGLADDDPPPPPSSPPV